MITATVRNDLGTQSRVEVTAIEKNRARVCVLDDSRPFKAVNVNGCSWTFWRTIPVSLLQDVRYCGYSPAEWAELSQGERTLAERFDWVERTARVLEENTLPDEEADELAAALAIVADNFFMCVPDVEKAIPIFTHFPQSVTNIEA